MTILQKFAEFIEASHSVRYSDEVFNHARRALLDWQGALIAGSNTEAADKLRLAYQDEIGFGGCSISGSSKKSSVRAAAFINGTISHIAEFDDIFRDGAYHPACPTISSVFALAEANDLSIQPLLRAIIAGYEVSTRIAKVIQPSHYEFFHTTGTVGVFGSAAACSQLLGLNAVQACDALATAGTFASGLQQAFRSDSMTKPMHAGHAAEVGVNAALTAKAGMTGTADLLEGLAGFGAAMSKNPRWSEVFDGLGSSYNITKMTFKNHGCCGHTFPAIDGIAYLILENHVKPEDIKKIKIGAYRATCDVCAYRHPASPFEAKFSLTYTVAARIILGRVREKAFLPEALSNNAIYALEDRIEFYLDDECSSKFPEHRSAKVEIHLQNGAVLTHYQLTRHGDPDDPLSNQELVDKFLELTVPRIGLAAAEKLVELTMTSQDAGVKHLSNIWFK